MSLEDTTLTKSVKGKTVPGPRGYPFVGILPKLRRDPLKFFVDAARDYGSIVRLQFGSIASYLITHPDYIKHVLQDNYLNYKKGHNQVEDFLGNGLASSDGDFWRRQRRLIQPAFHNKKIASLANTITDNTAVMLDRWRIPLQRGEPIDIETEMARLTQQIILKTMFTTNLGDEVDTVSRHFNTILDYINHNLFSANRFLGRLPSAHKRRYKQAIHELDQIVYRIITQRRYSREEHGDLLSMLMNARDEDSGEGMSDKQIRDEVMTIYFAGHETTAVTMSWAWHLISQHPEVEEKLQQEFAEVLDGRTPAFEDVSRLTYMRNVLDETMRLYPPGWLFIRRAIDQDNIGGHHIPANTRIMLCPYVVHRDPTYWPNPEVFDPERFTPERSAERPRLAYFPFSAGPRQCIGSGFAMMEAKLILPMISQLYQLKPVPGHVVEARPRTTLHPNAGILVTLHQRSNS